MVLRQLSNQVKGNVDDMLERAMGSSCSRGRREAKQPDEVNGTLVFHVVDCSWEDLFQLDVIHTKLCETIKMSALHSLQGRVSRERLGIWCFHSFFSFIAHPNTEGVSQYLIEWEFRHPNRNRNCLLQWCRFS